jgi:hypothetical protein
MIDRHALDKIIDGYDGKPRTEEEQAAYDALVNTLRQRFHTVITPQEGADPATALALIVTAADLLRTQYEVGTGLSARPTREESASALSFVLKACLEGLKTGIPFIAVDDHLNTHVALLGSVALAVECEQDTDVPILTPCWREVCSICKPR